MIGAERIAKATPDGYQMVLGNVGTHAQNQSLYKKPLYNAATDFAPVALGHRSIAGAGRAQRFPADDLQTFITYAKAHQATLKYGSAGIGGSNHLACALLSALIGIDATHIPYRSGGQAMQDMLAGRLDYQCPSAPVALPQIKAKTVKALAILSKNRSPAFPDLPSASEQGLTDCDIPSWYALFLPAGTPDDIVQKLNHAMIAAVRLPLVQQHMEEIGSDLVSPERMSSAYLGQLVATEITRWSQIIKANGIQLD